MNPDISNPDLATKASPSVTDLDLFSVLGAPSPELARRLVRMLNLPAVVENRLTTERMSA